MSQPVPSNRVRRTAASALAYPFSLRTAIMELFDIGPWVAFTVLAFAAGVLVLSVVYFVRSAPPKTITISSGPEGTSFYRLAGRYAKILERNGVRAKVLPSNGSIENLDRLKDPKSGVDVGMAQTGPAKATADTDRLMSLGSVSYQPLMVFYRGGKPLELLSDLKGKKIAVGPKGSGMRNIALALLAANGIKEEEPGTTLLDLDADDAEAALKAKTLDAAFVMNENASWEVLRGLLRSGEIHLYSFKQANAYTRKFEYLNVLELPEGAIDLGQNLPAHDVSLLGPTVELVAAKTLHPALVDLLVEAATEVHSRPGIYQKRGEFPMAVERSIPLSEEAALYYKSGKGYLYRTFPFWLASLLSRILVVFVPVLIIMIPALRSVPAFFRWIAQLRIRKRYRELRLLEQRFLLEKDVERRAALRAEFDRIDESVNKMKVRASFADQFYGLRGHIDYVRRMVEKH